MKTKFNNIFIAAVLIAGTSMTALTGCDDDKNPDSYIKVSERNFALAYDGLTDSGESGTFNFGANEAWKVSQKDSWLGLSHESGDRGSYTIFITAEENLTGEERTGFIEISLTSGKTEQLRVTQQPKTDVLKLTPATLSLTILGTTETGETPAVTVDTNNEWTLQIPAGCDWLTPSAVSGKGGQELITFSVTMNDSGVERTAKIAFTSGSLTRNVTVIQSEKAFTISQTKVSFANGVSSADETTAKLTVNAVENWRIADKPAWLTVTPEMGQPGETEITVTTESNDGDARQGVITLTSTSGLTATIEAEQMGNMALRPDSQPVGYVYYNDDFSWVEGGSDQVSNINGGAPNNARNIYTWDFKGNGFSDVLSSFNGKYIDLNAGAKTIYAMDGYLKFNAGGKQTALQLKDGLPIAAGRYADVELTFRATPNGTDKTVLAVAIEGDGNIDGGTVTSDNPARKYSADIALPANTDKTRPWQWTTMKVTLRGVTKDTKIALGATEVIKNSNGAVSGYYRWFMDDLKITRIETK